MEIKKSTTIRDSKEVRDQVRKAVNSRTLSKEETEEFLNRENVSLAEAMPKEQERVREVLSIYESLGPSGAIGGAFIKDALKRADKAVMSGDVVKMIRSYEELKTIED